MKQRLVRWLDEQTLPAHVKRKIRSDRTGRAIGPDPGPHAVLTAGIDWLCQAQDHSVSRDGGVARHYDLITGWGPSYPETTGYIVPTILDHAARIGSESLRHRARRMLDWLVSIQFPEGGFQGGPIGAQPNVPVAFNTGQILIGLARGTAHFGDSYREPMRRAADWLVESLDVDGCWRKHPTPFAEPGDKTYDTHIAWGLLEAARVEPTQGYAEAAMRNIRWAMSFQRRNGWMEKCCLSDPKYPLTHTLGYALRGLVEAYRFQAGSSLLGAAKSLADGLGSVISPDGFLPGRLGADWRGVVHWSCLTGTAQIAHCWFLLSPLTGDLKYAELGRRANAYVRCRVALHGLEDQRGAVPGSFPIDGDYCRFQYPNWATKFMIDANLQELAIEFAT